MPSPQLTPTKAMPFDQTKHEYVNHCIDERRYTRDQLLYLAGRAMATSHRHLETHEKAMRAVKEGTYRKEGNG